jgi:hypothetical protein
MTSLELVFMCVRISSQNISDFHRFPGFHGSINQVGRSQIVSRIRHGFSKKNVPMDFPQQSGPEIDDFPMAMACHGRHGHPSGGLAMK